MTAATGKPGADPHGGQQTRQPCLGGAPTIGKGFRRWRAPMPHEDQVLTERQAEKLNIGVWAAGGIMVFLLSQAVVVTLWLSGIKHSVSLVDQKVEEVQDNQASGQQRAEQRQAATEKRIDEVVTISRDRNTALDARIRPLETQSGATTATLQAINNSLLSLGSDIRDLRQAIRGEDDSVGKVR